MRQLMNSRYWAIFSNTSAPPPRTFGSGSKAISCSNLTTSTRFTIGAAVPASAIISHKINQQARNLLCTTSFNSMAMLFALVLSSMLSKLQNSSKLGSAFMIARAPSPSTNMKLERWLTVALGSNVPVAAKNSRRPRKSALCIFFLMSLIIVSTFDCEWSNKSNSNSPSIPFHFAQSTVFVFPTPTIFSHFSPVSPVANIPRGLYLFLSMKQTDA